MAMTIRMKQTQLHFLGYYNDRIDGLWGNNSINATKKFQKENKLLDDGIFGDDTEKLSKDLVLAIQKIVKKYNNNLICDGLAGNVTMSAVKAYQKAMGLKVTGIANAETRAEMKVGNSDSTGTVITPNTNTPAFDNGTDTVDKTGTFWDDIKYFEKSEFKCKCGGRYCTGYPYEPKEKLIRAADRVREHFGRPATVTSGLRCIKHNANEGGVYNSRHLTGKAMDFCIQGVSGAQLDAYVATLPDIRYHYIITGNYVHMDIL